MTVIIKKVSPEKKPFDLSQLLSKDISLGFNRGVTLNDNEKEAFYTHLYTMMESGVSLPKALELYIAFHKAEKFKKFYAGLLASITDGTPFSKTLEETKVFAPHEYYNVAIGEETGLLIPILKDLKQFYENKIKQRRKIIGVLVYPSIVLSISFVAVWFLLSYVVPLFEGVYARFGGQLPLVTQFIINLSAFSKKISWFVLAAVVALVFSFNRIKRNYWFRQQLDRLLLQTPVVGDILKDYFLSRFSSSMAMMLRAGVPFTRSLDMAQKMTDYSPIMDVAPSIASSLLSGASVSESFAKHSFFDAKYITLLKVGEEVNRLEDMFGKLATTMEDSVEYKLSVLNTLIEPFIIVFLGVVIGFVLIAMYLPLFNMGNQMLN